MGCLDIPTLLWVTRCCRWVRIQKSASKTHESGVTTPARTSEALRKIEARGAIETAHRVHHACGQVFRYGIATGRCERDPAADLRDALKPVQEAPAPPISDQVQPLLQFVGNC